jgi:hypothetical protein
MLRGLNTDQRFEGFLMLARAASLPRLSRPNAFALILVTVVAIVAVLGAIGVPSSARPGGAAGSSALPHSFSGAGWTNVTGTSSPPGLAVGGAMAYDPAAGYLVLFGGCQSGNLWYSTCVPSNQTWAYQNGSWSQLYPTVSPPARYESNLVWDAQESELVLFGGNGTSSFLNDTWTFSSGQWTQEFPSASPPARADAGMVYDAAAGYVLLTDGEQNRTLTDLSTQSYSGSDFNDSWVYSGGNWWQLRSANNPSARDGFGMTYDAGLGEVVLFGGFNWTVYSTDDTWVFSGGNWTELAPATNYSGDPQARNNMALAYDPALGSDVLFSGHNGYWFPDDTWQFTATGWSQLSSSGGPSARIGAGMTYDPALGCLVLFGGYTPNPATAWVPGFQLNDTWTYGCNGTGGSGGSSGGNGSSGNGSSGNGSSGNGSSGNGSSGGNGSGGTGSGGSSGSGNGSSGNSSGGGTTGGTSGGPSAPHVTTRSHPARIETGRTGAAPGSAPITTGAGAAPAASGGGIWISPIGFLLYFVLSTGLLLFVVVVRHKRPPAVR